MARFEGRYITGQLSDRRYDTDGTAEFFRGIVGSGVLALGQNLLVEAAEGSVCVWPGKAYLNGYLAKIVGDDGFLLAVPETPGACVYRVVLRQDSAGIGMGLKQGRAEAPPELERTELAHEISLAKVSRSQEGTITVADEREDEEVCGVCKVLHDRLPPPLDLLNLIYPVGSIYMSCSPTDPEFLFGGVWEAFGKGRALVGVNPSDGSFNAAEKTGGAKSVSLSAAQLPAHSHNIRCEFGATPNSNFNPTTLKSYMQLAGENAGTRASNGQIIDNTGNGQAHENMPPISRAICGNEYYKRAGICPLFFCACLFEIPLDFFYNAVYIERFQRVSGEQLGGIFVIFRL